MAEFRMSKWYLDCITDSGDVSIAYTGALRWGPLRLHYSSLLESSGERVSTRHSLRAQPPQVGRSSIHWQDAEWARDSLELSQTIFVSDAGSIEWRCLLPRGRARIRDRAGLGYVEQLIMTIAPWRLPITTLRWGRFLTPSDWIVWIDWQGPSPRRIVYRNGTLAAGVFIGDDRLDFDDGAQLLMDRSLVLREGPLGATALSFIAGVRDTFPARLLQVRECKWRSLARLERTGATQFQGWAIHERVDWPDP